MVVYDRLMDPSLLEAAPESAERVFVGKERGRQALTQDQINRLLVDRAAEGKLVVRLKGGDPFVFGRGGEEALVLAEHDIPFEVVPGISSAIAAAAYAGIPVTHRRVSSLFTVVSGSEDPLQARVNRPLGGAGPHRRHPGGSDGLGRFAKYSRNPRQGGHAW